MTDALDRFKQQQRRMIAAWDPGPYCARCFTPRGCRCHPVAKWLYFHTPGLWPRFRHSESDTS